MYSYQIISPFVTTINGDDYKEAIKNYVKLNYNNNINTLIFKDHQQHYEARLKYYNQDNKKKVGIDFYPYTNILVANNLKKPVVVPALGSVVSPTPMGPAIAPVIPAPVPVITSAPVFASQSILTSNLVPNVFVNSPTPSIKAVVSSNVPVVVNTPVSSPVPSVKAVVSSNVPVVVNTPVSSPTPSVTQLLNNANNNPYIPKGPGQVFVTANNSSFVAYPNGSIPIVRQKVFRS